MSAPKQKFAVLCLAVTSLASFAPQLSAAEKATIQARVAPVERVQFDVYLPIRDHAKLERDLQSMHDPSSPTFQKWLTPEQFDARYGATPAQIKDVQDQLKSYGLETSLVAAHHIHVTGTSAAVEMALGTKLNHASFANGRQTVVATQPILKPSSLADSDAIVSGFSDRILMRNHSHPVSTTQNRYSTAGPYWFTDLKEAYSFPSYKAYTGKGANIGILMEGNFNASDMALYFGHEKLKTPRFSTVNIDGGLKYSPDNSFETHLDLQQSGGMAPDANITLYNLPDLSDNSILDGLSRIVQDNKVDVVSMSFGAAELFYTAPDNDGVDLTFVLKEEDDLMAQGNAQGITFVASSGDSGALAAVPIACLDGKPKCGHFEKSVQFPASSPHVTAVGGTNLTTTASATTLDSKYVREQAYADPLAEDIFFGSSATGGFWGSGGGSSVIFKQPAFQKYLPTGNTVFRTVPDLALHMGGCPVGTIAACNPNDSADALAIGGELVAVIGTSASAPDFAGLTALNVQRTGHRLGNENYYIYTLALLQNLNVGANIFKKNIPGYNGYFTTLPKAYDRVLGNGTLNGAAFILEPRAPLAGTPQTPSNP